MDFFWGGGERSATAHLVLFKINRQARNQQFCIKCLYDYKDTVYCFEFAQSYLLPIEFWDWFAHSPFSYIPGNPLHVTQLIQFEIRPHVR